MDVKSFWLTVKAAPANPGHAACNSIGELTLLRSAWSADSIRSCSKVGARHH